MEREKKLSPKKEAMLSGLRCFYFSKELICVVRKDNTIKFQ
jgi:hypothetical protein